MVPEAAENAFRACLDKNGRKLHSACRKHSPQTEPRGPKLSNLKSKRFKDSKKNHVAEKK